jgi:nicotinamidase/pyrazinamidase
MTITIGKNTALVIVDVQRDFCPGGALPVPDGDRVVPVINEYIKKFAAAGAPIILTRDWHPPDHSSFKSQGGPWPPHCVQNTEGAKFHSSLTIPPDAEIISKADKHDEAYSFFQGTDLDEELHKQGIDILFVGGLATDYCVKETVLDGLKEDFKVYHLDDASRGIDVKPGDSQRALELMVTRGCKRITIEQLQDKEASTVPPPFESGISQR